MTTWAAILAASLACFGLKLAGMVVPERFLATPMMRRVAALLPVALLAALAAAQAFTAGQRLVLDARAAGLVVAALALSLRAPFLVVVGVAVLTTAAVRHLG